MSGEAVALIAAIVGMVLVLGWIHDWDFKGMLREFFD